jgi:PKD repeat protein
VCNGTPPANQNPTAAFSASPSGTLGVSVNASASSDPDGDTLSYAWTFGDGGTGSGVTAAHTYAAAGTYTIGLTVTDGRGGSATTSKSFTATSDPDPSTPTITSGQTVSVAVSATATDKFFKIAVPAGTTQLKAVTTGPSCGLLSCSVDADLYTRAGARPTDTVYACTSQTSGNAENCTTANPASGYWYVRIKRYSGSGTVNLTVTLS